jgi:hypothetical protein
MWHPLPRDLLVTNGAFTDARRYFKQSEIILFRQTPEQAANATQGLPAPPPPSAAKLQEVQG